MGQGMVYGGLPFPGSGWPVPDFGWYLISIKTDVWDIVFEFICLPMMFMSVDFPFERRIATHPFISQLHI